MIKITCKNSLQEQLLIEELKRRNGITILEGKYDQLLWDIDKWMPEDADLMDEFDKITSVDEMATFLKNNANEDRMRGFDGNWDALAKAKLSK